MRQDHARIYSGELAASVAVVSKQTPARGSIPPGSLTPPRLSELASHFRKAGDKDEDFTSKVARVTTGAAVYSVDKSSTELPSQLFQARQRAMLRKHKEHAKKDRTCPYCRLVLDSLYGPSRPLAVLNHRARIQTDFDADTGISSAELNKFQMLLPKEIAIKMLALGHPLRWHEAAPELFLRSDPACYQEGSGWDSGGDEKQWLKDVEDKGHGHMVEAVTWPLSPDVETEMENIIRISKPEAASLCLTLPKATSTTGVELRYAYSVASCRSSRFGSIRAPGVDIDGGSFEASALPLDEALARKDLFKGLMWRDLAQLQVDFPSSSQIANRMLVSLLNDQVSNWGRAFARTKTAPEKGQPEGLPLSAIREVVNNAADKIGQNWANMKGKKSDGEEVWLVTISANKTIHYTEPLGALPEMWPTITWMAPAVLFMLLNRGICQTPHFLIRDALEDLKASKFNGN